MNDGSLAAFTMTDCKLAVPPASRETARAGAAKWLSLDIDTAVLARLHAGAVMCATELPWKALQPDREIARIERRRNQGSPDAGYLGSPEQLAVAKASLAFERTCAVVSAEVEALARSHGMDISETAMLGGGGGATVILADTAGLLGLYDKASVISDHAVISAIGAALAVTCVSLSKSVASPTGQDIASLTQEVEARLVAQGAERVSTDYEFDQQRQVLTVTGRGNRPYEADVQVRAAAELAELARKLGGEAELTWESSTEQLWLAGSRGAGPRARHTEAAGRGARVTGTHLNGLALDRSGRVLWQGRIARWFAHGPGERDGVLADVIQQCTTYTDGGPALPGLALVSAGRLVPLELGDPALLVEVLRWEKLPDSAPGCFIVRA
jgi:hypothetical protein